ncbi:uncharacterized protein LOC135683476 [Rhopilema esculentum]|uniref:uncharacterized protein LOC135683476 n=1 Tax=Rhopilema esculentum TaxID=499914 RepID=UPI0031DBCBB7
MFKDSQKMKSSFVLFWHVLAVLLKVSNGKCFWYYGATTSLQTLSRTNYSNNEHCTFYIRPSGSYSSSSYYLEIKWISFNIEGKLPSCVDYVEIFLTSSFKSIGRYCSDNMMATKPFNMYSHDGYAKIVFKSDSSIIRPGFSLTYQLRNKSGSPMGGLPVSSTCYLKGSYSAATFFASGWPYTYYASSHPCRSTYYAGKNTVRVAVMDISLYQRSSLNCYQTNSYFQVLASSGFYRTSSNIAERATCVSKRIYGTLFPTVYTVKKNYVYMYFKRKFNSTGYRGIMAGYMAYDETLPDVDECSEGSHRCSFNASCTNTLQKYRCTCNRGYTGNGYICGKGSSSKPANKTGIYIGGTVGGVILLLIVIIAIICFRKRSQRANHSQAVTSAIFIAANASDDETVLLRTQSLQQRMTQSAVISTEGNASNPPTALSRLPSYAESMTQNSNAIPPPEYQTAIVPNSTYPTAPPPYSTNQPPPQNPSYFGQSSVVLLWHVLAILLKNASGVCYNSTNYATTYLQTLSRFNYSNDEYCSFDIKPASFNSSSSYYLEIEWISFNIEGKLPSCDDYVEAFFTRSFKSIGRYCSDNMVDTQPFNMYSHDGYAKIVFKSDSARTRSGFSLTYQLKSKSGSPMDGYPSSTCYISDLSEAATLYSSGWPYGYYASSSPCWRTYYAGSKAVRVAVMDISLYRQSSVLCFTNDSYFQVLESSLHFSTSSDIKSYASSVSGLICGTLFPTVYTATGNYVYMYINRPQTSTGYRGIMAGYMAYTKNDVNECTQGSHKCSFNAYCTNTVGSYRCTCSSGYTGNGYVCNATDECTSGSHSCSSQATCISGTGSYRCICKSGYTGNGFSCEKEDECTSGTHSCSTNAICISWLGSYRCICKSGYTGNGFSCEREDGDYCALGTHSCSNNATCISGTGSYRCICNSGFTGSGYSCMPDGDYCALGTHSCSNNATCISGTGSYRCICNSGFTGSGYSCMPGDGSSSKSASKAGIYIGGVVGGAVGGVFIILIIITVVLCCCKRSHKSEVPSTAIQTSHSQTATSATYIVANTSANGAFMQNTESLEQNMTQPAVIFSEGKASYPPAGLAPFRLHTARVAPDINTIPPPDYQTAIVPNSTYPTAPPPYSTSMESTNQPPPQNPSFFGPS